MNFNKKRFNTLKMFLVLICLSFATYAKAQTFKNYTEVTKLYGDLNGDGLKDRELSIMIVPGYIGDTLIDETGAIIGIINKIKTRPEKSSFAIKSDYLLNLLKLMSTPPQLSKINTLSAKPLAEQVKILKKFTYIIEVK